MSDRIAASLRRLFEDHRIVFWYDADRDMRGEFDAVDLPGVTKLEIANNEFGLKLRILRREVEGPPVQRSIRRSRRIGRCVSTSNGALACPASTRRRPRRTRSSAS